MIAEYLPILIFLAVAGALGLLLLALGFVLGPRRPDPEKLAAYECGFEAFEDSRMKFDVRYYLVAILFIVFDLEIAFLFPWAVALDTIGPVGAERIADQLRGDADCHTHQYEQDDGQVRLQIHVVRPLGDCAGADGETRTRTAFATTPSR